MQPLGQLQYLRSTTKDKALLCCPCCLTQEEDQQHFLRCSANPAQSTAMAKLIKILIDPDGHPYGTAIAKCMECTIQLPNDPIDLPYEKYPIRYHSSIAQAIKEQTLIGWHQLFRGYLTTSWQDLASRDLISSESDPSRGHHRTLQTLAALREYTHTIWEGRNEVLHKTKDTADAKIYSVESSEIRHYHSKPLLLPASDRHYCSKSLDKILQSNPSSRRCWLRRLRTARAALLKDG